MDKPPPGTIDAELSEALDRWRKISASSMEQLANVGEQLFGRLQSIIPDIIPDGTWGDQAQHVRDAICILFAMARNRTTEPLPAWRAKDREERESMREALHEALDRHRRDKAIATIRIQRPESKLNAWVIKFRRGNHVFELANLDLRWAIEAWRLARRAGKFE